MLMAAAKNGGEEILVDVEDDEPVELPVVLEVPYSYRLPDQYFEPCPFR